MHVHVRMRQAEASKEMGGRRSSSILSYSGIHADEY